jgi:hypothetical protein
LLFDCCYPKFVIVLKSSRFGAGAFFYDFEQCAGRKGFAKVSHAAGGFGLGARFRLVMGGDESEGHGGNFFKEFAVQVEPGHPTQLDVRDHEIGEPVIRVVEKCLGGEIGPHHMARRAQQTTQRLANAFIVVNDSDKGRNFWHGASMTETQNEMI